MEQITVIYLLKVDDCCGKVLEEKSDTFNSFDDALDFVKQLKKNKDLLGLPLIETV